MTTVSNTLEDIRLLRKCQRHERRDYKNNKKKEIELENVNIINDTKSHIDDKNVKLTEIKLNNYDKPKYKIIKKQILHEIAEYNVSILKLDNNFMMRNAIRTKMCPKMIKNKECKYDECLFAHNLDELRSPKCIAHIYGICSYGNKCKHDHSNSKLPEFPVKSPDEVQPKVTSFEGILLSEFTLEDLSLSEELSLTIEDFQLTKLTTEDFQLTKLTTEDFPLSEELSLTIEDFPLTIEYFPLTIEDLPLTIEERC